MTSIWTTHWPLVLIMLSSVLAGVSGLPLMARIGNPSSAQRFSAWAMSMAAVTGIAGALAVLFRQQTLSIDLNWLVPYGPVVCGIDPLSAFFLLPILTVTACGSVYAQKYWPADEHPGNVRKLTFFFGLLAGSLIWVSMARSAFLFLFSWEIMALSAFFALTADDAEKEVRNAGILYLICTHVSTLSLFGLFAMLKTMTGSFVFPVEGSIAAGTVVSGILFLTGLFGFGLKAGVMPLHIWLPSAHANAPSHVSAVMSGVILKIGIYGLFRLLTFFTGIPVWWGILVLALGGVSGILGVVFAIAQHDLKRLLAYHSIENIGIILMGLGIGLTGMSLGYPALVLLGMSGSLLHVINHAVFKALLFLGAGSVIHAVGTREIDRMGGLMKQMPQTALFFLIGAIAICGLPPLNGFVSEWLIYLGLFKNVINGSGMPVSASVLAIPALALIGGLALACFVKVFGVVFLGTGRSPSCGHAHEPPSSMRGPMAVLASVCVLIGVFPLLVAPILDSVVRTVDPGLVNGPVLSTIAPLGWISVLALVLAAGVILFYAVRVKNVRSERASTWGCGYLAPTPRMQYTASSFADMITGLFSGILRPHTERPGIRTSFPDKSRFSSHVPETVLENLYIPIFSWINVRLAFIRRLQNGRMHYYILYMFITLIVLLSLPV